MLLSPMEERPLCLPLDPSSHVSGDLFLRDINNLLVRDA